jgi:poly(3-hydroxybutyrate) depolymerase
VGEAQRLRSGHTETKIADVTSSHDCATGDATVLYRITDGGPRSPVARSAALVGIVGLTMNINANDIMWKFFVAPAAVR